MQPDRLAGAGRVRCVPTALGERPFRRSAAVVERRLADQLELDFAFQARHRPHEHVVGVLVGRRAGVRRYVVLVGSRTHGQRIADLDPSAWRLPRRGQHVRAGHVVAVRRDHDSERAKPEQARLAIEQRTEHAGRVEARHAQPVDRPVRGDKRSGVAVRQERIIGDRRKRRRRGGALCRALRRGLGLGAGGGLIGPGPLVLRSGGAHDASHGSCQRPTPASSLSAFLGPQEPGA